MINAAPIPKRPRQEASEAPQEEPGFLTRLEVAKRFRTSERQISRWMADRDFPFLKLGNLTRFSWPACEQWALARLQGEAPAQNEKSLGEGPAHPGHVSESSPDSQAGATTDDQ